MNFDREFFEFVLVAVSSLFIIIDPISLIPTFLAITHGNTPKHRIEMARLACLVAAVVLILFAYLGKKLFALLGITMPAFKVAGSIVLLLIALDMLRARRSRVQQTVEETDAAAAKQDIAITPLGVPMLAGPGAISSAILLETQARGAAQELSLALCIAAVCLASYIVLRLAAHGAGWINPIAMKIITRIMGLLLAAVAIQYIFDALTEMKGKIF